MFRVFVGFVGFLGFTEFRAAVRAVESALNLDRSSVLAPAHARIEFAGAAAREACPRSSSCSD